MKKMLAITLALVMVLTLAACGGKDDGNSITDKAKPAPTEAPTATTAAKAPETEPAVQGILLETNLWTLNYLEEDGWTIGEDELYVSDYSSDAVLSIYEPSDPDYPLVYVQIEADLDDPYSFRSYLTSYGFDQYEYAVNNAYPLTNVGGVDCLMQEGNYWGTPCLRYFNRVESAEATVMITIVGDYDDPRVATLLSGLQFNLTDVGNVDGPWYWNGEPFSTSDHSTMVGTFTLTSQWLPFSECIITDETFDHAVAASGGKVYVLGDGVLSQYAPDGSSLVWEADLLTDSEYTCLCPVADGLWLGEFMEPMIKLQNGTLAASYDGPDYICMHPSGTWGISYFSGPDCAKFDLSGGAYTETPISFPEVDTISYLHVDANYIYVSGYEVDSGDHKVFIYDHNGALQLVLADSDGSGLGSITFIAQTSNGFLALDGNMREVVLWTADGTYIGSADDGDLFGTYYPWFCGATMLDDGSILVVMTEDRADKSAMELVAFKLSGF